MFRLLVIAAVAAAASACEEITVTYALPPPEEQTDVSVSICPEEKTITLSNEESEQFVAVTLLEDYNVGYGVTRNEAEGICLIAKLNYGTFEERAEALREEQGRVVPIKGELNLLQVPVEDVDEFGERIANFCGDYPAYQLGTDDENTRIIPFDQQERTISITIRKCWLLFFVYSCTNYVFSIATGATITFSWIFG